MKIQLVSIGPSQAATDAGRITLTPELLAATGARYSRNNEGLEVIAGKIDFNNPDKSVDGIFKMVDYGHQSIADMAPVAIFIDQISIFAAFVLWYLSPTASGQESSTRYINYQDSECYKIDGALDNIDMLFNNYQIAYDYWIDIATKYPEIMKIPQEVDDKVKARLIRNYAFDRARVWLPISAKTNMMMIQSARSWVELISILLSHPFKELNAIGDNLKSELSLVTPRLTKHAVAKESNKLWMENWVKTYHTYRPDGLQHYIDLFDHQEVKGEMITSLKTRNNRYDACGDDFRLRPVQFFVPSISFAEIRDLNRHRTGNKKLSLYPKGFYDTLDAYEDAKSINSNIESHVLFDLKRQSINMFEAIRKMPAEAGLYSLPLGAQFDFWHTTTFEKFIYEAELRTGKGVHYKYAEHMRLILGDLYTQMPELKGLILEGSAEPE